MRVRRLSAENSRPLLTSRHLLRTTMIIAALALVASGCGDSSDPEPSADAQADVPNIQVTTAIWGDIVANVACGGIADVETIIPVGGDAHGFEPSLRDRERMENADLVVANGLLLELQLEDTLAAVEDSGTPVLRIAEHADLIAFESGHADDHDDGEDDHDDHEDHDMDEDHDDHEDHDSDEDHDADHDDHEDHDSDEDHDADHDDHDDHDSDEDHDADHDDHDDHDSDEDHDADHDDHEDHDMDEDHDADHDDHEDDHSGDDHGHAHGSEDPHVWFDPVRVSAVLDDLAEHLIDDAGVDADAVAACLSDYQAELASLDHELEDLLEQLSTDQRKLVTNHDALAYFADRYGFEVVGTVLPSLSTMAETNPAQLEELAQTIEREGVKAIFAETVHSSVDTEALASRVGDVEVVTLYTGSLGPSGSGAEDYVGFMRTNVRLIVDALG